MARFGNIAQGIVSQGQGAGFYSPQGSPLLRALLRRRAMRTSANQRRSGETLGRLAGLNPQAQQQNLVDTNRMANSNLAGALNEGDYQQLAGAQDFSRGVFNQERGYEQQNANRPGFGGILGGILGQAAGAFAPQIPGMFHRRPQQQFAQTPVVSGDPNNRYGIY